MGLVFEWAGTNARNPLQDRQLDVLVVPLSGMGFTASQLPLTLASTHGDGYYSMCEHMVEPEVGSRVQALDQEGWKRLDHALRASYTMADQVLGLFGNKLNAPQVAGLIELQNRLQSALFAYEVFPDVVGVPDDRLPSGPDDPAGFKRDLTQSTARALRSVLEGARALGRQVLKHSAVAA